MTNQLTKVRTCQSRKNAPKTTAAVRRAMTTVLITCEGEMRTHTTASLGTEASGSAGGTLRGFVCASVPGFACVSLWLISLAPTVSSGGPSSRGASGVISASPYALCQKGPSCPPVDQGIFEVSAGAAGSAGEPDHVSPEARKNPVFMRRVEGQEMGRTLSEPGPRILS